MAGTSHLFGRHSRALGACGIGIGKAGHNSSSIDRARGACGGGLSSTVRRSIGRCCWRSGGCRGRRTPALMPLATVTRTSCSPRPAASPAWLSRSVTLSWSRWSPPTICPSTNAARLSVWFRRPSGAFCTREISPASAVAAHADTPESVRRRLRSTRSARAGSATRRSMSQSGAGVGSTSRRQS